MSRSITSTAPMTRFFLHCRDRKTHRLHGRGFRSDRLRRLPPAAPDPDRPSAQLLHQEPGGSVGEAELILQLPRRHAIGMRRHEMCRPEPCRQRQLGAVHRRPRRDRSLTTPALAFGSVSPALQRRRATLAAHGADETIRPAPPQQKRRAGRFVGKFRLELCKRPRPRLSRHSRLTAAQSGPHTTYSATWDNAISLCYSGDRHGRRWHYPRLRTAMTVRRASLWVRALQALV